MIRASNSSPNSIRQGRKTINQLHSTKPSTLRTTKTIEIIKPIVIFYYLSLLYFWTFRPSSYVYSIHYFAENVKGFFKSLAHCTKVFGIFVQNAEVRKIVYKIHELFIIPISAAFSPEKGKGTPRPVNSVKTRVNSVIMDAALDKKMEYGIIIPYS